MSWFGGFWSKRASVNPLPPPVIAELGRAPLGGQSGRENAWKRCLAHGCWHRVPPGSIHQDLSCMRARGPPWGPPRPGTHNQGAPCCPGLCTRPDNCKRCLDHCPGACGRPDACGRCSDRCPDACNCCGRCLDRTPGKCGDCGFCIDYCECSKKKDNDERAD